MKETENNRLSICMQRPASAAPKYMLLVITFAGSCQLNSTMSVTFLIQTEPVITCTEEGCEQITFY